MRSGPRRRGIRPARVVWAVYLGVGIVATMIYAFGDAFELVPPAVGDVVALAVGLGAFVTLLVGPRWHHASPIRPWNLLATAGALFLVGLLVRPWAASQSGLASLAGDVFTGPGYLLLIAGLGMMIHAHGLQRHAIVDGLIVGAGAGLACLLLLALPAAAVAGRPLAISVLAATYPLLDVVLLLILLNLAFTTAVTLRSFRLLLTMMCLLFVGDVGYAVIGVRGQLFAGAIMDVPFLLGFVCIGAAALHPSIAELSRGVSRQVQPWSWPRLLLIGPALATPLVLIPLVAQRSLVDRVALAVGGAVTVVLLALRAVSAVQGYARAQQRAEHQATHDDLTGLPNRTLLTSQVDRVIADLAGRDDELWLLYLDLDGFKLVNDSWGHQAGDRLIVEVAARLQATAPSAAVVARVGGDEFVVVCLADRDEATRLAQRALEQIEVPLIVGAAEVVISASVGMARVGFAQAQPASAQSLMRDADTAMYQAKSEGPGNITIFDDSMHHRVKERVEIEYALRRAIAAHDLRLVYQPIVDLRTGRLAGAEALVRWSHPTMGDVSPTIFVPVAEAAGLIGGLGHWVIDESLRQLEDWRGAGVVTDDFWLSINVSPKQLRDPTLPAGLSEALRRRRVPSHAVVLEITESVMIEPWTVIDQVLLDLRTLGLRIVVDDFGTGYSALSYLRRHPVTGLKIDRAFVKSLETSSEDEEIVRAVVAIGGAMGLSIVAEGVETSTQLDVLAGLGVGLGQGFLWSKPLPPAEFSARYCATTPVSPAPVAGSVAGSGGS